MPSSRESSQPTTQGSNLHWQVGFFYQWSHLGSPNMPYLSDFFASVGNCSGGILCFISSMEYNWKTNSLNINSIVFLLMFSSVAQLCLTLCDPMNRCKPGLPVHHQLPESTQTHVHWVGDAIQPCHPLSSPSLPALNLSQHQGLFQWVSSLHQVAKVLEFQLQHQSFQWTTRTDLL